MVNAGSDLTKVTSSEINAIEVLLGSEDSETNGLRILRRIFEPEELSVAPKTSNTAMYYYSNDVGRVYDHYAKLKPKFMETQKLPNYEELVSFAVTHYKEHSNI